MEVSPAALMGNLSCTFNWVCASASTRALFSYTWVHGKGLLHSALQEPARSVNTQSSNIMKALQRSMLALLSRDSLRTWLRALHWFSSRWDKQYAADLRNSSSQGESQAAVGWGGHHGRTVIERPAFCSEPARWSLCSLLPECGAVIGLGAYGEILEHAEANGYAGCNSFPWVLHLYTFCQLSTETLPQFSVLSFVGAGSSWIAGLCLLSHPRVSACSSRWKSVCFPLWKAQKNGGNWAQVIHGGELVDAEQAIARVWLLLVPNANLCPFLRKQLFKRVQIGGGGATFCFLARNRRFFLEPLTGEFYGALLVSVKSRDT